MVQMSKIMIGPVVLFNAHLKVWQVVDMAMA